jgi:xanthine/uracil permease
MVLRFFPPLVTGTVIAMIGLSLIGADIGLMAGNKFSNFVAAVPVTTTVNGKLTPSTAPRPARWSRP